jgi:hypothetical protein
MSERKIRELEDRVTRLERRANAASDAYRTLLVQDDEARWGEIKKTDPERIAELERRLATENDDGNGVTA